MLFKMVTEDSSSDQHVHVFAGEFSFFIHDRIGLVVIEIYGYVGAFIICGLDFCSLGRSNGVVVRGFLLGGFC